MGDSFITIIAIFLAAILMFIFPMMAVSERTDDVSQLVAETATTDFVDNVRATGKLTIDDYDKFVQELASTGNSYSIELEAQILDENPGVKTTQVETTKIGENLYYNVYTKQLEDSLGIGTGTPKVVVFKEGDFFTATVKNTNITIAQSLKNFIFKVAGNDTYQIAAKHGGMIRVNGTKRD